jgi:hypothetical protein
MRLNIDEQYDKGPAFERVVSACIRKRLGDAVSFPIRDRQDLFANDSLVPFAEADVYVAKAASSCSWLTARLAEFQSDT